MNWPRVLSKSFGTSVGRLQGMVDRSKSYKNLSEYVDTVTNCAYLNHLGSLTSDDPTWPLKWGYLCAHIPISFCPSPMQIISMTMWIQWPIYCAYLDQLVSMNSNDHHMTFDPILGVPCVPVHQYPFTQVPRKSIKVCGKGEQFCLASLLEHTNTHNTHFKVKRCVIRYCNRSIYY